MVDLSTAEALTAQAFDVGRATGDVDLELTALAQLGLISVGQGADAAGFDMIDEAVVAALAGEQTTLDTVVYACCDMLNACELTHDVERAAQWCRAADDFVSRYGCPFLYAECRIYYGSVLTAAGRWEDAERELASGLALTEQSCPGLYGRALSRLAALRLRQGRLEDAADLLARCSHDLEADAEAQLSSAALALARGDAGRASSMLERRIARLHHHRTQLALALDLLVDAHIATGNAGAATAAANQLTAAVDGSSSSQLRAIALGAAGRAAQASGDGEAADQLAAALSTWLELDHPYEAARTRLSLAGVCAIARPDEAIDLAQRALAAFDELGAAADADRCAALLRSLGVTGRSGPRSAGTLTKREQEVLRLLASGLSNPEIADRLHVSRKTASHHVSNVLAKLGVRNRAEAAAMAARMGQLTDAPAVR
jgi:DNA-binding NarL/FixJ family response regulator